MLRDWKICAEEAQKFLGPFTTAAFFQALTIAWRRHWEDKQRGYWEERQSGYWREMQRGYWEERQSDYWKEIQRG
ncbi:hypothetical protein PBAL39_20780 [Pedobacter sp. BAL39]|nr:hypothetical protein PBAL39_20780 [Pedobacter sp. BAL39]